MAAATVAGAATLFLLGYLIWGMLLGSYLNENLVSYAGLQKAPPGLVLLALSNLVLSFLLAFIFDRWAMIRTFADGLVAAAIVGFLVHVSIELSLMG